MKKFIFCFVLLAGIAVSCSSCFFLFIKPPQTHKIVVDEDISADYAVLVTFNNRTQEGWFLLKEWNGEFRRKEMSDVNVSSNDNWELTVPAGKSTFSFNVRYTFSNRYSSTTYKCDNIELTYNLEQGKKYKFEGRTKFIGLIKGHDLFIGLYDVTGKKALLLEEWKLGRTGKDDD
jgi:hypothetical protein